jgi:hypothetical protein
MARPNKYNYKYVRNEIESHGLILLTSDYEKSTQLLNIKHRTLLNKVKQVTVLT